MASKPKVPKIPPVAYAPRAASFSNDTAGATTSPGQYGYIPRSTLITQQAHVPKSNKAGISHIMRSRRYKSKSTLIKQQALEPKRNKTAISHIMRPQ